MEIRDAIERLRATGRWNPFLRCFLFIVAWFIVNVVFALPLFSLVAALSAPASGDLRSSAIIIASMLAAFLSVLTTVWLFRRGLDRQSVAGLGLELKPGLAHELAWGLGVGIALMVLSVAVFASFGWAESTGSGWGQHSPLSVLILVFAGGIGLIMGAFYEELIFRGYLLQNLAAGSNLILGVLISSVIFGAVHLANPNSSLLAALNTGLAGLLFALIYLWKGSLWAPTAAHFGWNFTQNYILGLPVSGIDIFAGRSPILLIETGPDFITGGAFGPEGGIVATAVLAIASLALLLRLKSGY